MQFWEKDEVDAQALFYKGSHVKLPLYSVGFGGCHRAEKIIEKNRWTFCDELPELLNIIKGDDFMRMLENGIKVKAYTVTTSTLSVDTPKDLERVRKIMEEKRNGIDFKE